jgi:hypothetical protein
VAERLAASPEGLNCIELVALSVGLAHVTTRKPLNAFLLNFDEEFYKK